MQRAITLVVLLLLSWMTIGANATVVVSDTYPTPTGTLYLEASTPPSVINQPDAYNYFTRFTLANGVKPISITLQFFGGSDLNGSAQITFETTTTGQEKVFNVPHLQESISGTADVFMSLDARGNVLSASIDLWPFDPAGYITSFGPTTGASWGGTFGTLEAKNALIAQGPIVLMSSNVVVPEPSSLAELSLFVVIVFCRRIRRHE